MDPTPLVLSLVAALGRVHSRTSCADALLRVLRAPCALQAVTLVMPDGKSATAQLEHGGRGRPHTRTFTIPLGTLANDADLASASLSLVQAVHAAPLTATVLAALSVVVGASVRQVHALARAGEVSRRAHARSRALDESLREARAEEVALGSAASRKLFLQVLPTVARLDATVLITGETGTGKEVVARRLHELSPRARRPFVKINCGAIPAGLVESALFGHERGAFTGADRTQQGVFERATGGTLLLDEIGDLPLPAQARLLRALATREIERVGGQQPISVDVRIVAATHRDLEAMVAERTFRQDLLYRLDVVPLHVLPLRERVRDIEPLTRAILTRLARKHGRAVPRLAAASRAQLRRHAWPGNVRELENVLERSLVLADENDPVLVVDLRPPRPERSVAPTSFAEHSRRGIEAALRASEGRVYGPSGAAERLGLKPTTLASKMKRLGLAGPRSRQRG